MLATGEVLLYFAPPKMIEKHLFVVGVLCALIPAPSSAEEIEVHGCENSMEHVVEAADGTWWCERGPSGEIDQSGDSDPFDGHEGDEYSSGPRTKTKKKKSGGGGNRGGNGGAEAKRKAACNACKTAGQQCVSQSEVARQSCMKSGARLAELRCGTPSLYGGDTPWGCGIFDIYDGKCPGVEAPWNEKAVGSRAGSRRGSIARRAGDSLT